MRAQRPDLRSRTRGALRTGKGVMAKFTKGTLDSLEECLKAYVAEERLEAGAFACSACDAKTSAKKTLRIQRFPESLILHIKRFKLSPNAALSAQERWIKYTGSVSFPLQGLSLSAFASESSGVGPDEATYDLYAVINHTGSRDVGHYTAFCKIQASGEEQAWYKFDDEKVTRVRALPCARGGRAPLCCGLRRMQFFPAAYTPRPQPTCANAHAGARGSDQFAGGIHPHVPPPAAGDGRWGAQELR